MGFSPTVHFYALCNFKTEINCKVVTNPDNWAVIMLFLPTLKSMPSIWYPRWVQGASMGNADDNIHIAINMLKWNYTINFNHVLSSR